MARGENLLEGVNAKGIDLIDNATLEKYMPQEQNESQQPLKKPEFATFKDLKDLEKQGYRKEGTGFYRDAEHHLWRIEKDDGEDYKLIRLAEEEDNLKQSKLANKKAMIIVNYPQGSRMEITDEEYQGLLSEDIDIRWDEAAEQYGYDGEDEGKITQWLEEHRKTSKKKDLTNKKAIASFLEDWYLIGNAYDSGQDELWNFEEDALLNVAPPHIQGEENFIEEFLGLWGEPGNKFANEIIQALDETREKEITGEEKEDILKAIDKYFEDQGFDSNYLAKADTLVVYQLYGKGKESNKQAEKDSEEIKTNIKKEYEPEKINEKTQRIQYLAEVNTYVVKALLEAGTDDATIVEKIQSNLSVSAKQAKDIYKEIQNRLTKKTAKKEKKAEEEKKMYKDADEYEKVVSEVIAKVTGDKYSIHTSDFNSEQGIIGIDVDDYILNIDFYYNEEQGWLFGGIRASYIEPEGDDEIEDAGELSGYFGTLSDLENTLNNAIQTLAEPEGKNTDKESSKKAESKIGEADIEKQAMKEHLAEAYQKIMPLIRELAEKVVLEELPYEEASKELKKHAENEEAFMEILMALDFSIEDYEEILKSETKEGPDFDKRSDKTAEEERTIGNKLITWDESDIVDGQVEYILQDPISNLQEYHISNNKTLYKIWIQANENVEEFMQQVDAQGLENELKDTIRNDVYQDSDLFAMQWDEDMAYLSEILEKKNPEGHWYVTGKDLGWQKREGYKYVDTNDGAEFIREIAPETTDISFEISDYGTDGLYIRLSHHDAPTGESYYVISSREEPEEGMEASKKVAVSPPGWEKTVKKMKEHSEITNPYALAYWMKEKGYMPKKKSTKIAEEDIVNDTIPEGIKSLVMDLVNEIDIDEKQAAEELIQYLGLQTVEKLEKDTVDMNSLTPAPQRMDIEEAEELEEELNESVGASKKKQAKELEEEES